MLSIFWTNILLGDLGDPALHDGDIGDLGDDDDPGLVVVLILLRLSSLGVRSTLMLGLLMLPALDSREDADPVEDAAGEEQFEPTAAAATTTRAGEGDRERRRKEQLPLWKRKKMNLKTILSSTVY